MEKIRIENETRIEAERVKREAREKAAAAARAAEIKRVKLEWEESERVRKLAFKLQREAEEAEARQRAEQ